jgi:hypothetical protein
MKGCLHANGTHATTGTAGWQLHPGAHAQSALLTYPTSLPGGCRWVWQGSHLRDTVKPTRARLLGHSVSIPENVQGEGTRPLPEVNSSLEMGKSTLPSVFGWACVHCGVKRRTRQWSRHPHLTACSAEVVFLKYHTDQGILHLNLSVTPHCLWNEVEVQSPEFRAPFLFDPTYLLHISVP